MEPAFFALTTTPSIAPSVSEVTCPVSAAGAWFCAASCGAADWSSMSAAPVITNCTSPLVNILDLPAMAMLARVSRQQTILDCLARPVPVGGPVQTCHAVAWTDRGSDPKPASVVNAEAPVLGLRHDTCELRLAHMNQCLMIAGFQIHLRLLLNTVVYDDIQPVALADRRHSAGGTVLKQATEVPFVGEIEVHSSLSFQIGQADMMRRG